MFFHSNTFPQRTECLKYNGLIFDNLKVSLNASVQYTKSHFIIIIAEEGFKFVSTGNNEWYEQSNV